MKMNSKDRCLAAMAGQPVDRVPVFPLLMFLAANRAGITYRQFATDGRALADAQLNMRERFGVDAITVCSDAFRVPADLGAEMSYPETKPPFATSRLVTRESDLSALRRPDPLASGSRMADRVRAAEILAKAAGRECLVLGWVDMPFAEACSVCGLTEFMLMLVDAPALAHKVLEFLTEIEIDFALAQYHAGAPMIGSGDAAASLISPDMYREFALPYEQRVCQAVHDAGGTVKLHICGNTTALLPDMVQSGADLYNVDHMVPFEDACRVYGEAGLCFKGNLDPVSDIMQADAETCRRKAKACIREAAGLRYMLSAGCEIPAETPDEVFDAFCRAAGERSG